jgi:cytochrome P450
MNMAWNAADESVILRALGEWDSYTDDMVATRRRNLTDDLLSDLIRAEADGERLTAEELRVLVGTLLMAGSDTTRNQLATSVQVLCDHPRQWALLGRHPELAPKAVEATMRYWPILFTSVRTATEDVELGEVLIRSGTLVVVNAGAANRDPVCISASRHKSRRHAGKFLHFASARGKLSRLPGSAS